MSKKDTEIDQNQVRLTQIRERLAQLTPFNGLICLATAFYLANQSNRYACLIKQHDGPLMDALELLHLDDIITVEHEDGESYISTDDVQNEALNPSYIFETLLPKILQSATRQNAYFDDKLKGGREGEDPSTIHRSNNYTSSTSTQCTCTNISKSTVVDVRNLSTMVSTYVTHDQLSNAFSMLAKIIVDKNDVHNENIVDKIDTIVDKTNVHNDVHDDVHNDVHMRSHVDTPQQNDNSSDSEDTQEKKNEYDPADLYSTQQVADLLNITTQTVYKRVQRKSPGFPVPVQQLDKVNMFLRKDVDYYIALQEQCKKDMSSKECPIYQSKNVTCRYFRMTHEEGTQYVIPWYKQHNLSVKLIKHVITAVDTWLASDTSTARNARNRTSSHYMRLYNDGFIQRGIELARLAGETAALEQGTSQGNNDTKPVQTRQKYDNNKTEQDRSWHPERRVVRAKNQSEGVSPDRFQEILSSLANKMQ